MTDRRQQSASSHTPRSAIVALVALAWACDGKPKDAPPAAPSVASPPAPTATTGVDAVGNDAAVVALVKNVLACHWPPKGGYPDFACPAWKAWNDAATARAAASSLTYVNMLEDADPRAHILAISELALGHFSGPTGWGVDAALAKRVVAAAAAATEERGHIDAYSVALDDIDYAKTGLWPDAKALLDATPIKNLLVYALGNMVRSVPSNTANDDVWNWVKSKTKDPDPRVADAALQGFMQVRTRKQDACKVFAEALSDDHHVGMAVLGLSDENAECGPFLDAGLTAVETRLKSGKVPEAQWDLPLKWIADSKTAPEAQKKRALAALEAYSLAEHVSGSQRAGALRNVHTLDKARGLGLAKKLAHDKNHEVAKAASEIMAKP